MQEVFLASPYRTPIGRAVKGGLAGVHPIDLAATAIRAVIRDLDFSEGVVIDDVILGCATPEGEQGFNIARLAGLRAGLGVAVPGLTVNRFCASGLEAIAIAADRVAVGRADLIIAGGVESMSRAPFMGPSFTRFEPLESQIPGVYEGMGPAVEQLANRLGIGRAESDEFALQSQLKAAEALSRGWFDAEIVPVTFASGTISRDECPRPSSPEGLASLRPAFSADGIITAGNASPLSDGAAALIVGTADAIRRAGLEPVAKWIGYATAALEPIDFGLGPARAVPRLLAQTEVALADIGWIEINEAFAAQVLACQREFPLPLDRVNPSSGAIALGHPLGCTGARQAVTMMHGCKRTGTRLGMITMCAALGMGAAALISFDL